MDRYVISHDVGTSSVKTALVSNEGKVVAHHTTAYPCQYPKPGWVEQRPEAYWKGVVENTRSIVDQGKVDLLQIVGMVFSTQAMGIIPIDKDGNPLHANITWVDGRAEEQAQWLMQKLGGKKIFKKLIGVEITGKDVIPKLRWLKQNKPDLYNNTDCILDVNGYLKYRATGRKVFEWSGACSYGFSLKKKDWERLIFRVAGIDLKKLPPLVRSTDLIGQLTPAAARELNLPEEINVFGGCDDTQSAAMGSGANGEGRAHIYLGTSAWVGVTTARNLKHKNGAFCLQSGDPELNLLVGITESAGSNFDWLINNFYKLEKADPKIENIYNFIDAETDGIPDGSDHLIFTPWLLGERCPVSTTTTRGTIFNLSLEHHRGHMVKAMLEGIGYNLKWILDNYEKDFGFRVDTLRAIGGGSVNDKWMQGIANITGKKIETITEPKMAGAIGAATCAFVGSHVFSDFMEGSKLIHVDKVFMPQPEKQEIFNSLFKTYKALYSDLRKTYRNINLKRFNAS
jgi:xylulokinase